MSGSVCATQPAFNTTVFRQCLSESYLMSLLQVMGKDAIETVFVFQFKKSVQKDRLFRNDIGGTRGRRGPRFVMGMMGKDPFQCGQG